MQTNKKISNQIIILAIPIILSNMSRVIMSLADMAMVGHLGAEALAATGMGSLIVWIISSMGIGLRTGVQTVSARRLGQKKYSQCSAALWHGTILASVIAIPLTIIGLSFSSEISHYFLLNDVNNIMEKQIIDYCTEYISVGFFSLFFVLTSFVFQGFYISIKETKVHMVVTISSNMNTVLFLRQNSCIPSMYSFVAGIHPPPPRTGSIITAANSFFFDFKILIEFSKSL